MCKRQRGVCGWRLRRIGNMEMRGRYLKGESRNKIYKEERVEREIQRDKEGWRQIEGEMGKKYGYREEVCVEKKRDK